MAALLLAGRVALAQTPAPAELRRDTTRLSVLQSNVVPLAGFPYRDYMTTLDYAGPDYWLGQLAYVPAAPTEQAPTAPLYRLFRARPFDHMDSTAPATGADGFATEALLGFPFTQAVPGTAPLYRWYHPATGDHLSAFAADPAVGNPATLGYRAEGAFGNAFPRFGPYPERQLTVRGGDANGRQAAVTVNLVAGGAIQRLSFARRDAAGSWASREFINSFDFGRLMQSAFHHDPVPVAGGTAELPGPTEGGDLYGWPYRNVNGQILRPHTSQAHGSPLVYATVSGKTLRTACYPLFFDPVPWGGDAAHPVMTTTLFRKEVELDFLGNPNVLRYAATVEPPRAWPTFNMEVVTAYLTREFSRFWCYNPVSQAMEEVPVAPGQYPWRAPAAGALQPVGIIATPGGDAALGLYFPRRLNDPNRFRECGIGWFNFAGPTEATVPGAPAWHDGPCTKVSLFVRTRSGLPAGSHTFEAYVLVGTLSEVRQAAQDLYQRGY